MRKIDSDELIKGIEQQFCTACDSRNGVRCSACDVGNCLMYIDDAPTIEAEPMKHGRWKRLSHFLLECSCCGDTSDNPTNYCSECGARMEGIDES